MQAYWVYMMASHCHGTLYVGVTNDLLRRAAEHRSDAVPGFTSRYGVHRLVWFENHANPEAAIRREKRLKEWQRAWKIALIERANPSWCDLFEGLSP
jgi:putative endonuclease